MDSPDAPKTLSPESLSPDKDGWLLIGFLALLFCWNLGRVELSVTDEARSAVIVRDMVEDGHWLLPRTPDGYLCEKPLAYYGTAALLGTLLGINEWTLRLVSVFLGIATLLMTWILARLYGPPRAARIAVVALASNILFIGSARDAMVDMTLAFFLTAGLTAHFAARLGRLSPMKGALLAGLAFGFALLSKGPLGLAFPIAVVGGDAILEHRGRFWRAAVWWKEGLVTAVVALAIACLWYVPGILRGGKEFVETSILSENFRMPVGEAKGIGVSHKKPPLYYLGIQLACILPMLPLLPTLVGWVRDSASGVARRNLLAWLCFGFLLFQIPVNKRVYYLIPLQPAVAVMIALAAERALRRESDVVLRRSAMIAGSIIVLGVVALGIVGMTPSMLSSIRDGTVSAALGHQKVWIASGCFILFLAAARLIQASTSGARVGWSCVLAVLIIAFRFGVGDRVESEFNRTRPFVEAMAPEVPIAQTPVIIPPIRGYSLEFYWPRRLVRDEALAQHSRYILVPRQKLATIPTPYETLGTWKYGPEGRDDVLLLWREQAR
ncbi:MAG TPA: glycosyltransferase family 39 protein [Planctomycetota bacterium]|jgi:4-amino-4-deoxy-L-arabinose transferase-like glycosyltransferase|nr:glycosyltransferase family 39 protein [Planctomycetota bacterium]